MADKEKFEFAPLTIGTMRLGQWGAKMNTNELEKFIEGCIELGFTDIDHADIYGHYTTEDEFGKLLKAKPSLKGKINLITKCGIRMIADNRPAHKIKSYDLGANHIRSSVENSLKALSVESIDLLLLHRPDLLMSPYEIAEVFQELKQAGKVKHFGVSNFTTSQFHLLNSFTPLVTNQVEASITHLTPFNDGTFDQCILNNIRPMIWSPLGGGAIFGDDKDDRINRIKQIANQLAQKHDAKLDQLLMAWLLKHPSKMVPVLGTTKIERVKHIKEALGIKLSREEWYELLEASTGHEVA